MHITEAVDDYLYGLRHRSAHTRRTARVALSLFAAWCHEHSLQLEHIKPVEIRRYTDYLYGREARRGGTLSAQTIHSYLMRIKIFLRWCAKEEEFEDLISERVAAKVDLPHLDVKVIETFTQAQYKALYDACKHERYESTIYRDRAMLAVLMDTGIRAAELCGLTLEHVYLSDDDAFLRVMGKGRKQREVGLGGTARKHLRSYINRWRKAAKAEQHVFVNRMGKPMTPSGLNTILYRLAEWAGVTGVRVSCHTFRHTFACEYLLQGGDVYKLCRLLGHNSVKVTERYLGAIRATQARKGSQSVLDHLKDS